MSDRFIETHVRQLPLFAPLPDDLLQQTLSAMEMHRYEAGETVFHQGETSKGMYLLISGRAELVRKDDYGNDVRVGKLEPNKFISIKKGVRLPRWLRLSPQPSCSSHATICGMWWQIILKSSNIFPSLSKPNHKHQDHQRQKHNPKQYQRWIIINVQLPHNLLR
ncbi:MAG TPA: cyclic nucleotide-binding domain-containing protein, partial [Aggregatilineales bacterium]|nr:cyclic nucleotide-binding domain-containing protein [Aggregatilineales bacterium]